MPTDLTLAAIVDANPDAARTHSEPNAARRVPSRLV